MTFCPYATLGLARDASPAAIKAAYRAAAKRLHPDAGGGAEAFAALGRAYDILRNAQTRAHWDTFGAEPETHAAVPGQAIFLDALSTLLDSAAASADRAIYDALDKILASGLCDLRQACKAQLSQKEKTLRGVNRLRNRFTRRGKGENFAEVLLAKKAQVLSQEISILRKQLEDISAAIAIADDFDFKAEARSGKPDSWADPLTTSQLGTTLKGLSP